MSEEVEHEKGRFGSRQQNLREGNDLLPVIVPSNIDRSPYGSSAKLPDQYL
jgi:hypothetical protein